jgi:hypothetical protein
MSLKRCFRLEQVIMIKQLQHYAEMLQVAHFVGVVVTVF